MLTSDQKEAIRVAVQRCADTLTIWDGDAEPFVPPEDDVPGNVFFGQPTNTPTTPALKGRAMATLSALSHVAIGDDEFRSEVDTSTHLLRTYQYGVRTYSMSLRIETFGTDVHDAIYIAEKVRFRLKRPSTLTAFRAVNCALIDTGTVQELNGSVDTRVTTIAVLDFRLSVVHSEEDTGTDGYWIETADIASEVT